MQSQQKDPRPATASKEDVVMSSSENTYSSADQNKKRKRRNKKQAPKADGQTNPAALEETKDQPKS